MAKQSLASMNVDALFKLRDDVAKALSEKAKDLKRQLDRLADRRSTDNRVRATRRSVKGRKVAPKYRGPEGATWAGRGARPRWMQEAMKAGKKPEDFLIAKPARNVASKKSRKRKTA